MSQLRPSHEELINGYLDGMLTADQEAELNVWVKASSANAAIFAEWVAFDTRLAEHCRNASVIQTNAAGLQKTIRPLPVKRLIRDKMKFAGGIAASILVLLMVFSWRPSSRLNASTELDRLIAIEPDSADRSYRITNLDPYPESVEERRPPLEGAMLHVRQPNSYVLERMFTDGSLFLTGCDGESSWALPPKGKVIVSRDLERFRGPLPGHQHGLPFVNLKSDLQQLREAYDLALLPEDQKKGLNGLVGFKKSHEYRGARQVLIWYDGKTGVIRKMQFEGLPQARGGPASVAVDLVDQGRKPDRYYQHSSHHDSNREVVED